MISLIYDGTFEGLLTAVFEVYEHKWAEAIIYKQVHVQKDAFSEQYSVITDTEKSARVWRGLGKKISDSACYQLYCCYLSELVGVENLILQYMRDAFASAQNIEENFGSNTILQVAQIARKVGREKHRMEAFVRFRLLKDGIFYAGIEPDFNVLPIITKHFKSRYADQSWLIYDIKRRYGIHYDHYTSRVNTVEVEWKEGVAANNVAKDAFEPNEELYQLLWKDYFKHTSIPARRNMKLHIRHVPRRYWKYLIEKQ